MSVGYYTSDSLIEAVKRKAAIPVNQKTFSTDDFLAFANEELKMGIVPTILELHEEYYVYSTDIPLVASKSSYTIPYRSIGGKLRDVFYKDTNGNLREMSRINPEDKAMYQSVNVNNSFLFFYVQGNNIVLVPEVDVSPTGSLQVSFYMRPNDLVQESRVGIIQAIAQDSNAGTTTYTIDRVPTGFATNIKMDLLQAKPGHSIRSWDINPTSISTTNKTITFNTSDVDSEVEVGDHIAFAGECIIPQIPADLHPILAQRVTARCLEAQGDKDGLEAANLKLQELERKTSNMIDNRVEGAPLKITNNRGLLRSSKVRRRGWI